MVVGPTVALASLFSASQASVIGAAPPDFVSVLPAAFLGFGLRRPEDRLRHRVGPGRGRRVRPHARRPNAARRAGVLRRLAGCRSTLYVTHEHRLPSENQIGTTPVASCTQRSKNLVTSKISLYLPVTVLTGIS